MLHNNIYVELTTISFILLVLNYLKIITNLNFFTQRFILKKNLKSEIFLEKINKWNNMLECLIIATKTDLQIKNNLTIFTSYKLRSSKTVPNTWTFWKISTQPRWGSAIRSMFVKCVKLQHPKQTVLGQQLIHFGFYIFR